LHEKLKAIRDRFWRFFGADNQGRIVLPFEAHRFEPLQVLHDGVVHDYAALGQLGPVTRARISQILALLWLAPDLQEEILYLPPTVQGRDRVQRRHLLPIAAVADWKKPRQRWRELPERPLT
jgi:hypothetical protein